MSETLGSRVSARIKELGTNAAKVSRDAGLGDSYVRDLIRKGVNPTVDKLQKIAGVLGVSPEFLSTGQESDRVERQKELPTTGTRVEGIISAGTFRDISICSQEDAPVISVPQNDLFPNLKQYALEVDGDSMNKVVLPGTFVICVSFVETRLSPKHSMIVHVERTIAGTHLVETTLKEIEVRQDGSVWLVPRSTNDTHLPIEMNGDEATEIHIRGLVVSYWKPARKTW